MDGVKCKVGSFRESCLISAFYKKQHIDYLKTAAISVAAFNPDGAINLLREYYEELYPEAKSSRERSERNKRIMLEFEANRMYEVRPVFSGRQKKKQSEMDHLKQFGFK